MAAIIKKYLLFIQVEKGDKPGLGSPVTRSFGKEGNPVQWIFLLYSGVLVLISTVSMVALHQKVAPLYCINSSYHTSFQDLLQWSLSCSFILFLFCSVTLQDLRALRKFISHSKTQANSYWINNRGKKHTGSKRLWVMAHMDVNDFILVQLYFTNMDIFILYCFNISICVYL